MGAEQVITSTASSDNEVAAGVIGLRSRGTRNLIAPIPLAALVVAFAGLFAAGVLGVGHLLDLPVPCGRGHGCVTIAMHPSSKILGVPIAFVGVAAYLAIVVLLANAADSRRARIALVVVTGVGTLVSAGLLVYAQAVIRATCGWCVASGVVMAVLLVLAVALLRARGVVRAVRPGVILGLGMCTAVALGMQAGMMQRSADAPPIPAERLAGLTAGELIDPAKSLGPADAALTIVEFADLRCPACRASHASLVAFQRANPSTVRLAFRHLPLMQIRGHELSGAAAALGEIAAEHGRFWPFAELVYRRRDLRNGKDLLGLLGGLDVSTEGVEARIADPKDPAVANVWRDKALAEKLGVHSTPTFLVLVDDRPSISANQRTLSRILRSLATGRGEKGKR